MNKLRITFLCLFFSTAYVQAHPGIGIVMDSKGNVFYTDLTHVWKIATNGELSIAVKNIHTHELYIDKEDNLYGEHEWYEGEATDKWGNYVWCLTNDGIFNKTIPDVEGFLDNNTLVRDPEGNTYWAEKSDDQELLKKQTINGENISVSEHHFDDIRWMHFSNNDNNLYIVDNLKIKKVTPEGDVTILADNLKEGRSLFGVADRHYVFGTWTDQRMNVFVAVYGSGKVKKISPEGKISTIYESGIFWAPCGGFTAPNGTQWIMEFSKRNKTRIRKIGIDGKQTLYQG